MTGKTISLLSMLIVGLALSVLFLIYSHVLRPAEASGARPQAGEGTVQEKLKAPRIHHILLEVSSLEKSIAFYHGQFGFEVTSKRGGFATLKGDNVDIYLWEKRWDWEKKRDDKVQNGLGVYPHLLVDDVKATVKRLRDAGYEIVQEPRGYLTFTEAFVADPDHYTWALIKVSK
jgi:catechol 2,3-dioxygenase-like lactoylglutathione lyase family enzyme